MHCDMLSIRERKCNDFCWGVTRCPLSTFFFGFFVCKNSSSVFEERESYTNGWSSERAKMSSGIKTKKRECFWDLFFHWSLVGGSNKKYSQRRGTYNHHPYASVYSSSSFTSSVVVVLLRGATSSFLTSSSS